MSSKHVMITLLVIFCIGAKSNTISRNFFVEYDNFTLAINGSTLSPELIFDDHAVDKMRLAYGLLSGTAANRTCKVTQDIHSLVHQTKSQSCNVDINAINQNDKIVIRVALLDNDTVLILAKSDQNLQLVNVQLNSCQTYRMTIVDKSKNIYFISVVPDESTYDVIYLNPEICGARRCKITFNYKDATIVKNATEWGPLILDGRSEDKNLEDEFVQTILSRSSKKGYLIYEHHKYQEKKIYLVRENDSTLLFASKKDEDALTTSIANDKIGICSQTSEYVDQPYVPNLQRFTLECKQYDLDGRIEKLNMQLSEEDFQIKSVAMHNLPDGFLLLIQCSSFYEIHSCVDDYHLMRFNATGKLTKSMKIGNFYCKDNNSTGNLAAQFFQNDASEYCISLICSDNLSFVRNPTKFSLNVRCFSKSDL